MVSRQWLSSNGYRNQIQPSLQPRGQVNKPLSEAQQKRNHRLAKTRARVEHVFGAIEQMGSKTIRTIGQARANFTMTVTMMMMMMAC